MMYKSQFQKINLMTGFVVQGHKWVHPHNQYLLKVIANLKNEFEKN